MTDKDEWSDWYREEDLEALGITRDDLHRWNQISPCPVETAMTTASHSVWRFASYIPVPKSQLEADDLRAALNAAWALSQNEFSQLPGGIGGSVLIAGGRGGAGGYNGPGGPIQWDAGDPDDDE